MNERYHINAINWVCSCSAYSQSHYFFCKYLVAKKNILPIFMEIVLYHNYPLVFFGANKISLICQENDSWKRYKSIIIEDYLIKESHPSFSNLQNAEYRISRKK